MIARGLRNNNPLNIRRSKADRWKGLKPTQQDAQFCEFETMEDGWRAAFVLLTRTYYHKYRLYTIRSIVSRWAPPHDHNDTDAYIAHVARLTDIPPDEPLGIPSERPERWMMVATAMAVHENGTQALDYFAMMRGWGMRRDSTNKY